MLKTLKKCIWIFLIRIRHWYGFSYYYDEKYDNFLNDYLNSHKIIKIEITKHNALIFFNENVLELWIVNKYYAWLSEAVLWQDYDIKWPASGGINRLIYFRRVRPKISTMYRIKKLIKTYKKN